MPYALFLSQTSWTLCKNFLQDLGPLLRARLVSSEIYLNFLILVLRIYIYVYITSNSIYIPGRCCYIYCCYYWPQLYLLVVISVVIHLLVVTCQAFPVICNKVEKFRGQKLLCSCVLRNPMNSQSESWNTHRLDNLSGYDISMMQRTENFSSLKTMFLTCFSFVAYCHQDFIHGFEECNPFLSLLKPKMTNSTRILGPNGQGFSLWCTRLTGLATSYASTHLLYRNGFCYVLIRFIIAILLYKASYSPDLFSV